MLPIIAANESNRTEHAGQNGRLMRQQRSRRVSLRAYDQSPAYTKNAFPECKLSLHVIASFAVEISAIIPWHYALSS